MQATALLAGALPRGVTVEKAGMPLTSHPRL